MPNQNSSNFQPSVEESSKKTSSYKELFLSSSPSLEFSLVALFFSLGVHQTVAIGLDIMTIAPRTFAAGFPLVFFPLEQDALRIIWLYPINLLVSFGFWAIIFFFFGLVAKAFYRSKNLPSKLILFVGSATQNCV